MTDYPHLNDEARLVVESDAETRIQFIQADRYIPNPQASVALDALLRMARRPTSVRPLCIALIADGGAGKSTVLNVFRRQVDLSSASIERSPIAYCVIDAFPNPTAMQIAMLSALDIPKPNLGPRWNWTANDLVKQTIKELHIKVVVLDEIHHLNNLPERLRQGMWDWIKWLSTACRVSIVCAGPPGSEQLILQDLQLKTRFRIYRLTRWRPGPEFANFLKIYESSIPLKRASGLSGLKMQETILRETSLMQQSKRPANPS